MVRNALGGALYAVALRVVPNPQIRITVVLVYREKPPAVFRTHKHSDFVRELIVNLKTYFLLYGLVRVWTLYVLFTNVNGYVRIRLFITARDDDTKRGRHCMTDLK